jgi:hypothetical protein
VAQAGDRRCGRGIAGPPLQASGGAVGCRRRSHRRMARRLANAENGPFPSPPMRSAARYSVGKDAPARLLARLPVCFPTASPGRCRGSREAEKARQCWRSPTRSLMVAMLAAMRRASSTGGSATAGLLLIVPIGEREGVVVAAMKQAQLFSTVRAGGKRRPITLFWLRRVAWRAGSQRR